LSQNQKSKKRLFSRKTRSKQSKSMKKMRGGMNLIGTHPVSDLANLTSKITGYPYVNSSTLFSSPYTPPNTYLV
jgi:hypothetical protein